MLVKCELLRLLHHILHLRLFRVEGCNFVIHCNVASESPHRTFLVIRTAFHWSSKPSKSLNTSNCLIALELLKDGRCPLLERHFSELVRIVWEVEDVNVEPEDDRRHFTI